ncbi:MAG: Re/Si-specific NAD(P)(+) transhydrogenase subunit alpha [Cellulomonadaceae bacterium]|jgi:NAD(P) transhydrogenase subunit alpha|nr:Re/Si-specific NAD(P)(+) transhydrogenase subunit alpha [Cellulomonadaceae bacterium]
MRIGVPHESQQTLVAATPATVTKLVKLGYEVAVEAGAGTAARFSDAAFTEAGAAVTSADTVWSSDVVIAVECPSLERIASMRQGAILISQVFPGAHPESVTALVDAGVTGLALDAVPRISRAQALDTLSTMSNVSGYRAVIEAASEYQGMFAGQVTAAGKTAPAHVFVIGGGVAGLAAIGTAVSLGASVRAFDVRPEAGEQIESMGATFVQAKAAQQEVSSDGYARELTSEQEAATEAMYAEESAKADVIITTALVRGSAPRTITNAMIDTMKPGSVIVDLAASGGGNAEACVPGERAVTDNGVIVLGYTDLPGRMPAQTSQLYGQNIVNLMALLTPAKDGQAVLNMEDVVQRGMCVALDGTTMWPPPPVQVSAAPTPAADQAQSAEAAAIPAKPSLTPEEEAKLRGRRQLVGGALAAVLILLALTFSTYTFLGHFTVFALAVVIGYYVISGVSHSLHTPLMAQTNAISGIILVGAMLQLGHSNLVVTILAVIAATVASINIFGGFLVSRRMIAMFQKGA